MGITTIIPRAFQTREMRRRADTKLAIRQTMMTITHNTVTHAEVIARGPVEWRNHVLREMRGLAIDTGIADLMYVGICKAWKEAYGDADVKEVLDQIEVKTPLTEKEIDDAWEHDASSSSYAARRQFYMDYPSRLPQVFNSSAPASADTPATPAAAPAKGVH